LSKTSTKTVKTKKNLDQSPFEASLNPNNFYEQPDYTDKETQARQYLLQTLEIDRNRREQKSEWFNGMTYTENYRTNALAANSYTPPRKNAEDTQVVTGTTREKVLAIVSAVLNLNFESEFRAFDKDDIADDELGEAMSDCVIRSNMIEQWEEKKLYAYFEMTVQGDVYVEELFIDQMQTDKKKIPLDAVTEELMKSYQAETETKMVNSMCVRNLIPGTQVFKGSMTERNLKDQPHIFTVQYKPYEWTKSIYGNLPRFKNVPRKMNSVTSSTSYGVDWRLQPDFCTGEVCEIIKYQDKWNDEYQLIINGVMMLPVGFPMPWEYAEYNITQGSLEPISAFFSESKSIPTKTKLDQEILDEMYRLAVLKTQKSFMPPIANYSTNLLSRSMFLPGKVNNSMQKGEIEVLGGDPSQYSMKPSEFEMIQMIKKFIDEKSVNPILQGQSPQGGDTTATEVNTIMKQAQLQLGLLIFGFIQFHMNLDMLRLYNILENYTKSEGEIYDKVKEGVAEKFRSFSLNKDLGAKGYGIKKIQFTNNHNTPAELHDMENGITRNEAGKPISNNPPQKPVKIMQISPKALRSVKYTWYNSVIPKERDSSIADRISYEDRLTFAMKMFGAQQINMDYAQSQWATKNKIDAGEFFNSNLPQAPVAAAPVQPGAAPQESNLNKLSRPFSSGAGPAEAARQGFGGAG
jgi:hypothetical protein